MLQLKFTINGERVQANVPDQMPLLWFLRDILNLTGTKYSCGRGFCGACTVHVNDKAVRSCMIPVSSVDGQNIRTIEGMENEKLARLREAWVAYDVPQCGYCQVGQIMQAAALLARNPQPEETEIRQEMSGNICRCGTYGRIMKAIKSASEKR